MSSKITSLPTPRSAARSDAHPVTLEDIRACVKHDLQGVDALIRARLKSAVPLVDQIAEHIIGGGGKRLRPLLCVLAGRACGIPNDKHIEAAAFIEFVHTATLLHDDVVDGSQKRRGRATANNLFGNQASVLVGDFVYSRAFQMMATVGSQRVMEIMADATNVIAEGEVLQLMNAHDPETTEQRYLEVIYRKTGRLFEAGAEVAAVLAGASVAQQSALAQYGKHLGTAYQLIDDVLDYKSDPATRGKNLGDDLAEGKPTLPLLHALRHGNDEQRALIRLAIEQGGLAQLGPIVEAIEVTGGLEYATNFAQRETAAALAALEALPETPFSRALAGLAKFAQDRTS
ncbi:MAG TPA: octaprenyl diphosphate synthase [Steroidobacteraceae bacterium]|nr:octaprenyl diphosphate synthase [Steroidobacteraceae bacterium]